MSKPFVSQAHIAKFNELTVPEVHQLTSSTVGETALAILNGQGSRVSSDCKFAKENQIRYSSFKYTY
jgi:hypothetical protein